MFVICAECGSTFDVDKSRFTATKELLCSVRCIEAKWKRTFVTKTCENCGNNFEHQQPTKHIRFCCWQCYCERDIQSNDAIDHLGEYHSLKAGNVLFDSEIELQRMHELDRDSSVVGWEKSQYVIPWIDLNNQKRLYYPDLYVEYVDGTRSIEEIKGYCDANSELKINAGKIFFEKLGVVFRILNRRNVSKPNVGLEHFENDYGCWDRPTFESTFMNFATMFANRSTCIRQQVGAVFTNSAFTRVICFGYNGGVVGDNNQCESLEPGLCGCIHAEVNAMMKAQESLEGSFLFVTLAPCPACAKLLINRGIKEVFYMQSYRKPAGILLLEQYGVKVTKWSDYIKICDKNFHSKRFDNNQ